MEKEISLEVSLAKGLNEEELNKFVDDLIDFIEKLNLYAGGGLHTQKIDWVLDCSESLLSEGEIIDRIGEFLMGKGDLVLAFETGKPSL